MARESFLATGCFARDELSKRVIKYKTKVKFAIMSKHPTTRSYFLSSWNGKKKLFGDEGERKGNRSKESAIVPV